MKTTSLLFPVFLLLLMLSCTEGEENGPGAATSVELALSDGSSFSSGSSGPSSPSSSPDTPGEIVAGVITAGEWNDLDHWDFWKALMETGDYAIHNQTWGFKPESRYSFLIKDIHQQPIQDATIVLKNAIGGQLWEGRTDNAGRAELWPELFKDHVLVASAAIIYKSQSFALSNIKSFDQGFNEVTLPIAANAENAVDVMLVVDATGSMADELEYLKNELYDVLERSKETTGIKLRTGAVFYRDEGDDYVTRTSRFTSDISTTVKFVKQQSASGGGDYPEAVHRALKDAIHQQSWSLNARTRLLFLVLDAPPHETIAVKEELRVLIRDASMKGIKIIPVTASGIDENTEFLMRYFAISTNGTYVFVTGHSGIGDPHLEPTVGEYDVEYLNNLMVRLIQKYSE